MNWLALRRQHFSGRGVGINPGDFRQYVIKPALAVLGVVFGGDAAEELLLGTALQESQCGGFGLVQRGGPALGVFQIEPATHDDVWKNYLADRAGLAAAVMSLRIPGLGPLEQLPANHLYGCAIARLIYFRAPAPLPAAGDLPGQAAFYKTYYNTADGAASVGTYIANWRAAFPGDR